MDTKYIITPSGSFISTDELYHWGIKGMKWGVRRYQNSDGTLTAAGKKRYTNADGSLNKKGKKYIAKETERLKSEKTKLENQKKVNGQLDELAKMRKANQDLKDEVDGKKKAEPSETQQKSNASKPESYDMGKLSNKEVKDFANRLNDEDRLKDLLTKRGYNVSLDQKTEIDAMIDSLSKEKKLAELKRDVEKLSNGKTETEKRIEILTQKRDIAKLEKEIRDNTPKKENKLTKFMNSEVGKNLTKKLIDTGVDALVKRANKDDKNADDNKNKKDKNPNQNNNQNNDQNNNSNKNKDKNNNQNQNSDSNKSKDKDSQNSQNNNSNKNKDRNDPITNAGVNAVKDALSGTLGKEYKNVVKSVERQQTKTAEKEARQEAKELDKLITKASKASSNSDSYYNSKAYEAKVDKLLADMDNRAWEIYLTEYANK